MSEPIIQIGYPDLLIALVLVLGVMGISLRLQLGVTRDLAWGAMRSFVQLAAVGYVLAYLFAHAAWYWTVLALAIMLAVAVHTAVGRVKDPLPGSGWVFTTAIVGGSLVVMLFVLGLVLRVSPWHDPRYVLPLAGMIIGNAMTAGTLAINRFLGDLRTRRLEVETALALGATPAQAVHSLRRDALRTAIIPSINGMLVVGVVSLPGMMTGQIIAGSDPTQAVHYQIVVMYMITAAAGITSAIAVLATLNRVFTTAKQLHLPEHATTPLPK